jgi:O-antigen/teichoic acid export membrane protein
MSEVVRSAAGSFGLKVSGVALAFLTSVMLARILGSEGYGLYAWVMAWAGLLTVPALLGLDRLMVREAAARGAVGEWGEVRGILRWSFRVVAGFSILLAAAAASVVWFVWSPEDPEVRTVFVLVLASLPFVVLTFLGQAAMRGLRHVVAGQVADTLVRPGLFVLLVGGGFLFLGRSLDPADAALLYLVASALGLGTAWVMLRRRIPATVKEARPRYRPGFWLGAAMPMLLVAGLAVINSRTDTIMLGAIRGTEPAGVYFVATRAAELIAFLLFAFNMPLAPAVAALHASGDREGLQRLVTKTARFVVLGALPVAVGMVVFGRTILGWFGPAFPEGHTALAILCVGQVVNAAAGSVGLILNMTGFQKDAAIGVGISAVLNIVLNSVLIPLMGINGAAIATTVSLVVWNVILGVMVHRRLGVHTTALGVLGRRQ